ncbi:hypothetical protein cypCar_00028100 [Cyprinus carpio]|nr:hypothetical protein cypCar_00028100 [Cyprinus carpio]
MLAVFQLDCHSMTRPEWRNAPGKETYEQETEDHTGWKEWHPGFPMSIDAKAHSELPREIQFDSEKGVDFVLNYSKAIENLYINQFMHMFQSSWGDFEDFERIFMRIKNTISEYVMEHWKEDFMFGYQFLNGCNPVVIRKCTEIPDKFPVTQKILEASLERGLTLEEELKEGNIFIADYELLDGVTPNATDPCTIQYLAAPICLLYKNSQNKIMPIAIQLGQTPGEDNPIFLPTDDEHDWLLAKIWANGTGGGGHVELVQKSMKNFTYRSLCFPEAIKARGMDSQEELPYYFYRDDGCRVWQAVTSFVTDVVNIYYDNDKTVQEDVEIQAFVKDVCSFGMQDFDYCEFPKTLRTKEQLVEYLTIVIFTASAQHAGVNFGQFDWCSWIPNSPPTMRKPPPTKKGEVDMKYIVESLPDRGRSCWHLGAVWALSQFQENELFLGMYPDEHFIEKPVKDAMVKFCKNLSEVTKVIKNRNEGKKLPYYYLSPDRIPNSVAV